MVATATQRPLTPRRLGRPVRSNAYGFVVPGFRVSSLVLVLAVLPTAFACGGTSSASRPTGSPSNEAPAGRFTQCLSITNYSNAQDSTEMRAHAQALRALNLDDDLRGPADALARSYVDLADSLDNLEGSPQKPDSPTDVDSYLQASDRYNDAHGDVRLACRQ